MIASVVFLFVCERAAPSGLQHLFHKTSGIEPVSVSRLVNLFFKANRKDTRSVLLS